MNMSQEEFKRKIYDVIKDKAFISNGSGVLVDVVKKLPEQIEEGKVLFDGLMLFDGIEGIEDDIQQMHSYTKDGDIVNLEDYYTDNGAFDDDGWDRFISALNNLMTREEYTSLIVGDFLDLNPYTVEDMLSVCNPEKNEVIDIKAPIIVDNESVITDTYFMDGFFHIVTKRIPPSPVSDEEDN